MGSSSAHVAFVLPAIVWLNQNVGLLVAGVGRQSLNLREGACAIGSRRPRLDVFQLRIISDARDRRPGAAPAGSVKDSILTTFRRAKQISVPQRELSAPFRTPFSPAAFDA